MACWKCNEYRVAKFFQKCVITNVKNNNLRTKDEASIGKWIVDVCPPFGTYLSGIVHLKILHFIELVSSLFVLCFFAAFWHRVAATKYKFR